MAKCPLFENKLNKIKEKDNGATWDDLKVSESREDLQDEEVMICFKAIEDNKN